MLDSVLHAIGRTPLIRLNKITEGLKTPIYVKMEAMNAKSVRSILERFVNRMDTVVAMRRRPNLRIINIDG